MLSAKFVQIKKLRSTGNFPAARELIATTKPASDEDALEAVICFYSAAEFEALMKFSAQHKWGNQWPAKTGPCHWRHCSASRSPHITDTRARGDP
jgi:hypothetical protein